MKRGMSFFRTTIGQTALMAVTGLALYLCVLGHLLGNLQIYLGRDQINGYARLLHSHPVLLWTARALLFAAVLIHITVGVRLWWLGRRTARPKPYLMKKDVPPAYASRTMMRSGAVILVFVVFHVLHLTTGSLGLPFRDAQDVQQRDEGRVLIVVAGGRLLSTLSGMRAPFPLRPQSILPSIEGSAMARFYRADTFGRSAFSV